MKFKSLILATTSFVALSSRAQEAKPSEILAQLNLASQSPDDMVRAWIIVDKFSLDKGTKAYAIEIDAEKNTAKVKVKQKLVATKIDDLIAQLNNEFGASLKVEKVPVESIVKGTQDDQMR